MPRQHNLKAQKMVKPLTPASMERLKAKQRQKQRLLICHQKAEKKRKSDNGVGYKAKQHPQAAHQQHQVLPLGERRLAPPIQEPQHPQKPQHPQQTLNHKPSVAPRTQAMIAQQQITPPPTIPNKKTPLISDKLSLISGVEVIAIIANKWSYEAGILVTSVYSKRR